MILSLPKTRSLPMWTVKPEHYTSAEQKEAEAKAAQLAAYKCAFDNHLDAVAQSQQYDNRLTIAQYAVSTNPQWQAEAQAFIAWRDAALNYMFSRLAAFEAGSIEPPSVEDFIAGLPAIEWPEVEERPA
jgi:hypothetical protein